MGETSTFIDALGAALVQRVPRSVSPAHARPAAVLIPLYSENGEWNILFTERTETVEDHKGQVSFPGGRVEDGDRSRVETALRETEEETGLRRDGVRVIGLLDEMLTVTHYRITPVVGLIPWPYPFVVSRDEIAALFGVPLRWLADPAHRETRMYDDPVSGARIPVFYFRFESHTIWGITARILSDFLDICRPLLGL